MGKQIAFVNLNSVLNMYFMEVKVGIIRFSAEIVFMKKEIYILNSLTFIDIINNSILLDILFW